MWTKGKTKAADTIEEAPLQEAQTSDRIEMQDGPATNHGLEDVRATMQGLASDEVEVVGGTCNWFKCRPIILVDLAELDIPTSHVAYDADCVDPRRGKGKGQRQQVRKVATGNKEAAKEQREAKKAAAEAKQN